MPEDTQTRLAGVAQESFIHGPPPRAAWTPIIEWVEKSTLQLPAHEGKRRPLIPEMDRWSTWWWRVGRPEQVQPGVRPVANLGYALRGDGRRWRVVPRCSELFDIGTRIAQAVSMAIRAASPPN